MRPLKYILVRSVDQVSILWISTTIERRKGEGSDFTFKKCIPLLD